MRIVRLEKAKAKMQEVGKASDKDLRHMFNKLSKGIEKKKFNLKIQFVTGKIVHMRNL